MKVQQIQQNQIQNNKQHPKFKGFVDTSLRFLTINQGLGANGVDVAFMVLPRTTTDMLGRGPLAGMETLRREASGTANHSLIGPYGIAAGALMAYGINKQYGTNINKVLAAPETVNILAENKANQLKNQKTQLEYIKETLSNLKAYNPSISKNADGMLKISEDTVNEVASIINDALNDETIDFKKWSNEKTANSFDVAKNKIIADVGAESKYILESSTQGKASHTDLKAFLEDIYRVSETFNKEEVQKAFIEQIDNGKSIAENKFIKSLTKFNKNKAIAGFAIASAIGMSIQPINVYLTKRKTGSDGFVGVEGRTKDTSAGFLAAKVVSAGAFGAMVMKTLGTGFKNFLGKMAYTGFWPTMSQLKGVYGLTIMSRILATRDKDELRESLTKDTLGFLSWLVLGDIVNKMTANALDESVMNRTKETAGKGYWKKLLNSSLKTRDEILLKVLAENDIEVVKKDGEKIIAKTFKELMGELDKLPEKVKAETKQQLKTLNKAQLAGYLFSGLVLGLGIPNLNIFITNTLDKKHKAKLAEQQTQLTKA